MMFQNLSNECHSHQCSRLNSCTKISWQGPDVGVALNGCTECDECEYSLTSSGSDSGGGRTLLIGRGWGGLESLGPLEKDCLASVYKKHSQLNE